MTTSVTFMVPGSKNAALSVMFTPEPGLHSPTLTMACCFNFNRSNLNCILRPSLNSIGPVRPFSSTWNQIKSLFPQTLVFPPRKLDIFPFVLCS